MDEDERLIPVLSNINKQDITKDYGAGSVKVAGHVTASDVDSVYILKTFFFFFFFFFFLLFFFFKFFSPIDEDERLVPVFRKINKQDFSKNYCSCSFKVF